MQSGRLDSESRDSKGISELPLIQLILKGNFSCIRGSSEIPLISLSERGENGTIQQYLLLALSLIGNSRANIAVIVSSLSFGNQSDDTT